MKISNVAVLSHIFHHKDQFYILGVTPCFSYAWMMSQESVQTSIKETLKMENPKVQHERAWTNTIKEVYICSVSHGDNCYKLDVNKRYKHFIWITQVPSNYEHKLKRRATLRGKCIVLYSEGLVQE